MTAKETPLATLQDVLAAEKLNEAWAKVKANAGAAGVDGLIVGQIAELIRVNREELLKLLTGVIESVSASGEEKS